MCEVARDFLNRFVESSNSPRTGQDLRLARKRIHDCLGRQTVPTAACSANCTETIYGTNCRNSLSGLCPTQLRFKSRARFSPERLRSRVVLRCPKKPAGPRNTITQSIAVNTKTAICVTALRSAASRNGSAPDSRKTVAVNSALAGCGQSWNALNSQGRKHRRADDLVRQSGNCFHTPSYDPSQQFFVAHTRESRIGHLALCRNNPGFRNCQPDF